jgi:hypothetical protein
MLFSVFIGIKSSVSILESGGGVVVQEDKERKNLINIIIFL